MPTSKIAPKNQRMMTLHSSAAPVCRSQRCLNRNDHPATPAGLIGAACDFAAWGLGTLKCRRSRHIKPLVFPGLLSELIGIGAHIRYGSTDGRARRGRTSGPSQASAVSGQPITSTADDPPILDLGQSTAAMEGACFAAAQRRHHLWNHPMPHSGWCTP
jgi:hypothetical protein